MEVVAGERPGGPFTRHNVQEWSRLDQLTGLLEHARVETDHWTASTSNSSHHFGKVVDSRSRNLADGGQEQRQQTKQLEVFQAHIPGGSLQVIRSSTSSSWQTHKVLSGGSGWSGSETLALPNSENEDFDHLKLTLNPLDLSSQKTKASVGRSGSIGSRRPPSRPRSLVGLKPDEEFEQTDSGRLSSLCHKVHKEAKAQALQRSSLDPSSSNDDQNDNVTNDTISQRTRTYESKFKVKNNSSNEVTKSSSNSHTSLVRKKSCSSEDLHVVDESHNETDSTHSDWRRSSKVRRSLQFPPKQNTKKESIVIPITKSVAEIKRDIEARKQLVTNSFKANQWNNFAELEGVLGVIVNGNHEGDVTKDSSNSSEISAVRPTKVPTKKRQTFITEESLKEVRGRLRKRFSPVDDVLKAEDVDDGIDTEVKPSTPLAEDNNGSPKNSVKSYVYGMEAMLQKSKQPMTGTGSLESRTSNKSLTNGISRSEEWYNRRKSYGFEQVSSQQNNCSSFEKSKIESSTDSGICRSSDNFPSWQKISENPSSQTTPIKTTHNIIIKPYLDSTTKKWNEIEGDAVVQKGRKTVVNLTSNPSESTWAWNKNGADLPSPQDENREGIVKGKIADAIRSLREKSSLENQRLSEPITISIPLPQTSKSNSTDPANLLLKQTKTSIGNENIDTVNDNSQSTQITPYSELLFGREIGDASNENNVTLNSIPWRGNRTKALSSFFDSEFKRHSIAVDQAKYLVDKKPHGPYFINGTDNVNGTNKVRSHGTHSTTTISTKYEQDNNTINPESDHESSSQEKKHKKVEFCKTEVHFAAEPGRFNIVETDGKPPPSNIFRRRRKTTSDAPDRSGLPEIRFGDTQYEKNMLTMTENTAVNDEDVAKPFVLSGSPVFLNESGPALNTPSNIFGQARHPSNSSTQQKEFSNHTGEEIVKSEDETSKPRSILKNNIPKPKPYILGEFPENLHSEDSSWGVKLKSVTQADENPKRQTDSNETEFQRLLKSLRPSANKLSDRFEYSSQSDQFSTAADNGLEVRITSSSYLPDHRRASWSVADRIRHVEETKGYSTKVNFGPQETVVVKADEVPFNSSDAIRSWHVKEQLNPSYDTESRLSPGSHLMLVPGAEPPRVTSIALHYDSTRPPTTVVRPTSLYSKQPVGYVSKSLLNSDSHGISSKVELSSNGERTWSFSKLGNLEKVTNNLSDRDQPNDNKSPNRKFINSLNLREISSSPSRFSRNSQSPSKETSFLERTAERSMLYNENNRHTSTSPTSGTSQVTSSVKVKSDSVQSDPRKNSIKGYSSKALKNNSNILKNGSQHNTSSISKTKLDEKVDVVKKSELKTLSNEARTKERKLSTGSSGRDGWLNTPKEVQVRKKSDSSFRKHDSKKETKANDKNFKVNGVKPSHKRIESPIYQNREIYAERRDSNDNTETESTILEELTKAADQILLAVNGYTDDDSFRASSDDEYRKKREKPTAQPLCTISEVPTKTTNAYKSNSRQSIGVIKSTRSTDLRKEYHSSSKSKAGKTSSNSSVEGGPSQDAKPLLSSEDRSKRRAARLLQRASSRELLFQSAASSSEDVGSGSDTGSLRTKRTFRRPRLQNGKHSGSKQDLTPSAGESRAKDRVHRASSEKPHRPKQQSENRCSRHSKGITGLTSGERRERRPQAVVTSYSSRTQKNTKETEAKM